VAAAPRRKDSLICQAKTYCINNKWSSGKKTTPTAIAGKKPSGDVGWGGDVSCIPEGAAVSSFQLKDQGGRQGRNRQKEKQRKAWAQKKVGGTQTGLPTSIGGETGLPAGGKKEAMNTLLNRNSFVDHYNKGETPQGGIATRPKKKSLWSPPEDHIASRTMTFSEKAGSRMRDGKRREK